MKKLIGIFCVLILATAVSFGQNFSSKESLKLLEADRAFAKMSEEKGSAEAFDRFMADDIIFLPVGENIMSDKKAVVKYFSEGVLSLKWTPLKAEAAHSKDIGYTYGISEMTFKTDDGKTVRRYYKYLSVWRKNKNGEWKMIIDIGNSHPAPPNAQTATK